MLLTDPIYYFGTFLLQKKDTNYSTFEDMKGHTVGTVTGFTLVPELKIGAGHRRGQALRHLGRRDARHRWPAASTWRCSIRAW